MKRAPLIISLIAAGAAGIVCGELVCRSVACRDWVGILCGRGHLLALVGGDGIYEVDLQRGLAEMRYASGADPKDRPGDNNAGRVVLTRLVANAMARSFASDKKIARIEIADEEKLARWQFRDEATWRAALRNSGLSIRAFRSIIADDLRARRWISGQIAQHVDVTADECRQFYDAHPESFWQPVRLRASHLFLAAPPETPAEIVDAKQKAIESLSDRLANGENFSELVAEASEDEATKTCGGDLGYFSALRMPPDFVAEAMKLRVGQFSRPIRTRLGFHIIQLSDFQLARQLTFAEAQAEIALALENGKRQETIEQLIVDLARRAEWSRQKL